MGGLALALVDLDDFRTVNDRHGHRGGDQLLSEVAAVLRGERGDDAAFRIGGDEFALLLPGAAIGVACDAADSMRDALSARLPVTCSVGIAALDGGSAELLNGPTPRCTRPSAAAATRSSASTSWPDA